ncbi:DUF948 domain-containing protein [Terrisporobacter sp.]
MNALGWQICAVLIGLSFFIVSIYLVKILNSTYKVIEKTNRLLDVNERYINDIIDNASHITKDVKDIIEIITKITSLLKIFKFFKR